MELQRMNTKINENVYINFKESISFINLVKYLLRKLKRKIKKGEYPISDRYFFWINGFWSRTLVKYGTNEQRKIVIHYYELLLFLKKYLKMNIFEIPDHIVHAGVLLILYDEFNYLKFKPLINEAYEFIIQETNDGKRCMKYRSNSNSFYLDTLGMIDDFCFDYKRIFNDGTLEKVYIKQLDYAVNNCEYVGGTVSWC